MTMRGELARGSAAERGEEETPRRGGWRARGLRWLLLSAMWVLVAILSAAQNAAWHDLEWAFAFQVAVLDWGPWIFLSPIVIWFAQRVQINGRNWLRTVPLHLAGALAITAAVQAVDEVAMFAIARRFVVLSPSSPPAQPKPGEAPGKARAGVARRPRPPPPEVRFIRARFTVPVYCVLVAAAHAAIYHRRSLERERRALTAEARLAEARLIALQMQLNPHFLFNTLNAISGLVYTSPEAADEMICGLSELLRRVLAISERREVTLAEELDFVARYLAIQRIRFADRLDVQREVPPELHMALVPTLILQPLVENAILHGIALHAARGAVTVRARESDGRLLLSVHDKTERTDAPASPTGPGAERIGLRNTRERLAAMYGATARFKLAPAPEGGMSATIDLPLRFAKDA